MDGEIHELMLEVEELFSAVSSLRSRGSQYKQQFDKVSKILEDRKKKGEKGDLAIMIQLSIENGNRISKWIHTLPILLRQKLETLKDVYDLKEENGPYKTSPLDMTLSKISHLFPVETCKMMRGSNHILSNLHFKFFLTHVDAAVMHLAFNLLIPMSLKKILDLTKVFNALRGQIIGSPETRNKPLHKLLEEENSYVETQFFATNYLSETDRYIALMKLGLCKLDESAGVPRVVPTRDFVAMIVEGCKLYETIKIEKWDFVEHHYFCYIKYSEEELKEKVTEFLKDVLVF